MKYYVCKLTGPRATFPQDMTPQEAAIAPMLRAATRKTC